MLVGKFDGQHVDTLIAEPIGEAVAIDDYYPDEKWYFEWRVYTKGGTVAELIFENITTGISLVAEGDLDGDGADDWGFVNQWHTSNWMSYNTFSYKDGHWSYLLAPTAVWLVHFDKESEYYSGKRPEDLVSRTDRPGWLLVRESIFNGETEMNELVDTIMHVLDKRPLPSTVPPFDVEL